jgi:hypothetical protein
MAARKRRPGAGLARYTPLLFDPRNPNGGWVVWDSHRDRAVSGILGVRVSRDLAHAERRADRLNREAGH